MRGIVIWPGHRTPLVGALGAQARDKLGADRQANGSVRRIIRRGPEVGRHQRGRYRLHEGTPCNRDGRTSDGIRRSPNDAAHPRLDGEGAEGTEDDRANAERHGAGREQDSPCGDRGAWRRRSERGFGFRHASRLCHRIRRRDNCQRPNRARRAGSSWRLDRMVGRSPPAGRSASGRPHLHASALTSERDLTRWPLLFRRRSTGAGKGCGIPLVPGDRVRFRTRSPRGGTRNRR